MGIYIEGMEMPSQGEFKHIRIYDNGDVTVEVEGGEAAVAHAVPVPPHGRLIDADELTALVYANIALFDSEPRRIDADQKLVRAWLTSMVDDIEDAPTIIPAEEGET